MSADYLTEPDALDTAPPIPTEPAPFDTSALIVEDVPPAEPHAVPDHTASDDSPSVIDRVKAAARGSDDKAKDTANARASKAKKRVPASRPGALVRPLVDIYTSIGVVIVPFDPGCGAAVMDNAQKCAESLDALAQRNDSVRRALLALTETSAWGGVLSAHLPLLLMIASHHAPKDIAERTAPLAYMMNPNNPVFNPTADAGQPVPPEGDGA